MLVRYAQTKFDEEKRAVLLLSVICKDAREVGHGGVISGTFDIRCPGEKSKISPESTRKSEGFIPFERLYK